MSKYKVAVLTTHPIQYHAKWYRALAEQQALDLCVLYCHKATPREQADAGFGVEFDWDVPLLEGYCHRFLHNISPEPSATSFFGMDTPEIRNLIASERYDAVMVIGWHYKSAWQAIRTCWRHGIPVMVRSDSHLQTERHPVKKLLKALPYRWFIRRLDACLPVGQRSGEYFLHYGARPDRLFLVPHAVDPSFEQISRTLASKRPCFRETWGLSAEATVFLFVGKFTANKRPLDFVHAIEQARRRNRNIEALMVGDGPLREDCERIAGKRQLPVRFTGFLNQSKIVPAYIAADALVLSSDGETWGLVVNEAMSCGLPCLVSDQVGCAPDLVHTGETGFIYPLGDVTALAARLVECASRPERLRAMGENARKQMTAYSIPAAVNGVLQALSRVVA